MGIATYMGIGKREDMKVCRTAGVTTSTVGENNSFGITVEEINNQPVIKAFNTEFTSDQNNSLKAIALTIDDKTYTCKNYTVVEKSNFSYSYSGIKEIKTVAASEKIHILILLKNGTLKGSRERSFFIPKKFVLHT